MIIEDKFKFQVIFEIPIEAETNLFHFDNLNYIDQALYGKNSVITN